MIGQTVSHYRITAKLGEGGMGVVYRADDLSLDRQIAIKVLPPGLTDVRKARVRLLREAKAASALQHPNICSIFEIGTTEDDQMFMVMPCYEGESLKERLDRGSLPLDEAIEIGRQIGSALAATHAKSIIHRDIKPGNVMLTNGGTQAVLMDFGLARPDDVTRITRTGATVGTVAYMSPEQLRGEEVDARSDLWSLGVVLYEMVTGEMPFKAAGEAGLFDSILHDDPVTATELQPEAPTALAAMIDRMLAKTPAKRINDATEVTDTLKAAKVLEAPFTWHMRQWVRRHRRGIQSITTIVIIVAAFLTWQFWPATQEFQGIAVLPFEDLSEAGDQEWFCDGMTGAVIQSLGEMRVPGVIARHSMMKYRESEKSISEIADELDTDAVVEANVLSFGNMIRVNARLIRGDNGEQIWADSFEREMKNVLQLNSEIAKTIAEKIRVAISPDAGTDREVDPEAYRHYLRGTYWWSNLDLPKMRESMEEAIRIDPAFPEAWAGLAMYHTQKLHGADPVEAHFGPARAALNRAFEIEPDLQIAHAVDAHLAWEHEWDHERASRAFARAEELNPSSVYLLMVKSYWLLARRHFDEAADTALRTTQLDPLHPFAFYAAPDPLAHAGRFDEAHEILDVLLERFPDVADSTSTMIRHSNLYFDAGDLDRGFAILDSLPFDVSAGQLVGRYSEFGRMDEAWEVLNHALEVLPEELLSDRNLAHVYARLGDRKKFEEHIARAEALHPKGRIDAAGFYMLIGDADRCFEILEEQYRKRNLWLRLINYARWLYDPLHDDPRFMRLIHRMGLDA